jgi:hypothetical protein
LAGSREAPRPPEIGGFFVLVAGTPLLHDGGLPRLRLGALQQEDQRQRKPTPWRGI